MKKKLKKLAGECKVLWEIDHLLGVVLGFIIGGSINTYLYCVDAPRFIEICGT